MVLSRDKKMQRGDTMEMVEFSSDYLGHLFQSPGSTQGSSCLCPDCTLGLLPVVWEEVLAVVLRMDS